MISYFSHGAERLTYVLQRGVERYEVHARSAVAVNDSGAMLAAGLAGLGIARTAPFMAAPHLAAGTLIAVLPEWSAGTWPLYVVYPPNRHVSVKLRVFVDWVADLCARTLKAPTVRPPVSGRAGTGP